jgi:hypothetical protein
MGLCRDERITRGLLGRKVFPSASHGTVQGMAITCTKPREESLSKHKAYLPSDITWKPPTVNRGG